MDACLEMVGSLVVAGDVKDGLMEYANAAGPLSFDTDEATAESTRHVVRMIQLIVATREYQFA